MGVPAVVGDPGGHRPGRDVTRHLRRIRPPTRRPGRAADFGPRLDGTIAGTATIADSDGGRIDGDPVWDRAAGPMQFIPTSWQAYGEDGNSDRVADPQNLFDAALAAAAHLCGRQPTDLTQPAALRAALFGYNPSAAYVGDVTGWADRYTAEAAAASAAGEGEAGFVLPVDRTWIDPDPTVLDQPHHDYPAWDLPIPTGTALLAVTSGTVATVDDGRCGLGLLIRSGDGWTYTYCHLSALAVANGERVAAGQLVGRSGNTGNSSGPHLHFAVTGPDGTAVCPQPLLRAWYLNTTAATQPTNAGCVT